MNRKNRSGVRDPAAEHAGATPRTPGVTRGPCRTPNPTRRGRESRLATPIPRFYRYPIRSSRFPSLPPRLPSGRGRAPRSVGHPRAPRHIRVRVGDESAVGDRPTRLGVGVRTRGNHPAVTREAWTQPKYTAEPPAAEPAPATIAAVGPHRATRAEERPPGVGELGAHGVGSGLVRAVGVKDRAAILTGPTSAVVRRRRAVGLAPPDRETDEPRVGLHAQR